MLVNVELYIFVWRKFSEAKKMEAKVISKVTIFTWVLKVFKCI